MPEGPEIRRQAEALSRLLARRRAREVYFAFRRLKRFEKELAGRMVRRVDSVGKAILVRFGGDWTVFSHNQLYGRWLTRPPGETPETSRSLRFAVRTANGSAFLYSASEIEVLREDELGDHPYLGRLGPDILASETDAELVTGRLQHPRFAGRSLAGLLLDQGFLAGVGNYLRSEILHQAGIHPRRRPRDLDEEEARRLAQAARTISCRAFDTGGITNDPRRADSLRRRGLSRTEYRHAVFGRGGEPCWVCGSEISRAAFGGRRIYFCPRCQPESGASGAAPRRRHQQQSGKETRP